MCVCGYCDSLEDMLYQVQFVPQGKSLQTEFFPGLGCRVASLQPFQGVRLRLIAAISNNATVESNEGTM